MRQAMKRANTGSSLQASQSIATSISSSRRELQNHDLLQLISGATGGLALLNARALTGLETPAADTRTFYWLGFDAEAQGDEELHEIQLEIRIGALDEHGQISDIPVVPVLFSSLEPPQAGSYGTYRTTLKLRRDAHDLLITAYDPLLDQMLASRVSVDF